MKRPPSAYLLFCAEHRPEVQKTTKKLGEVTKQLAALWAESKKNNQHLKFEEQAKLLAEEAAKKTTSAKVGEWR